jgi:ubiquinone/menaquinone biosynthesis C-methylase UbiE
MERTPEPEIMDGAEQSEAYAHADFAEVNRAFVQRFLTTFPNFCCLERQEKPARGVDLGCGPADIPIRMCRAIPRLTMLAVDASPAMLALARVAVDAAEMTHRVELLEARLPAAIDPGFDALISNSILHHLEDPAVLWSCIRQLGNPGASILVMDLMRPATAADAKRVVAEHSPGEPEILQHDFYHSLLAAYRPEEVRAQLDEAGLGSLSIEAATGRHLCIWGHL